MKNLKKYISNKGERFNLMLIDSQDEDYILKLEEWCRGTDECKGFPNLWTKFKNWDNPRAFVYIVTNKDEEMVGLNVFTCNNKNPYVNLYYFEIDKSVRRQGLGKKLFFECISQGKSLHNSRLTLRTKTNSIGINFYSAIGMKPRFFDPKSKEYIFDMNISKVEHIEDIKKFEVHDRPNQKRLNMYRRKNYEQL